MKELKEISWQVDEPTYRQDPAFSYSLISSYQREGIKALKQEKKESESLLFGSIVDTLLTEEEEFENKFFVVDINLPTDIMNNILNIALEDREEDFFSDIPKDYIVNIARELNYGASHWKDDTIHKKIDESISECYNISKLAKGRTIVPANMYKDAEKSVSAIKEKFNLLNANNINKDIKVYYQLKFKGNYNNIPIRIMMDIIVVNYNSKMIIPMDLKTSYKSGSGFTDSFFKWRYNYQANIYPKILLQNIEKDDYFKDFTLLPFKFIVISREDFLPFIYKIDNNSYFEKSKAVEYKGEVIPSWEDVLIDLEATSKSGSTYTLSQNNGSMIINMDNYLTKKL